MRNDFRLSRMLHVLVHLHGRKGAASSEEIATILDTNPVLVRRMLAGQATGRQVRQLFDGRVDGVFPGSE